MKTMIERARCKKCDALIRFDDSNPKGDATMGSRPRQSDLFLAGEKVGSIKRGNFRGAATWEYECGGCINGVPLDGH